MDRITKICKQIRIFIWENTLNYGQNLPSVCVAATVVTTADGSASSARTEQYLGSVNPRSTTAGLLNNLVAAGRKKKLGLQWIFSLRYGCNMWICINNQNHECTCTRTHVHRDIHVFCNGVCVYLCAHSFVSFTSTVYACVRISW